LNAEEKKPAVFLHTAFQGMDVGIAGGLAGLLLLALP